VPWNSTLVVNYGDCGLNPPHFQDENRPAMGHCVPSSSYLGRDLHQDFERSETAELATPHSRTIFVLGHGPARYNHNSQQAVDSTENRVGGILNKQEVRGFEVSFDLAQKFGGLKLAGDPGIVDEREVDFRADNRA
jgi:hypothetical protein